MGLWKFRIGDTSPTLLYAKSRLEELGWEYDDTAKYLLLPVPAKKDYARLVEKDTVAIGGYITLPCICVDLLQDPYYLAENAKITAYCALQYATEKLPVILDSCRVLVIGWGRIGKCLAQLLRSMGAHVTVYARKPADRATLSSLGYTVTDNLDDIDDFRVIFNTVPFPLLSADVPNTAQIKIDLASVRGIDGDDVIWARGLPGKDAPESSGKLIADTVEHLRKEGLL